MSIQAVTFVLEDSPAEHGDRLVLLSLANHAHRNGTNSYPSVATIAHEARMKRRAVQYALISLACGWRDSGVAIVETGAGPNGERMWTVLMDEQAKTFRSVPRKVLVERAHILRPPGRIKEPEGGAKKNAGGAQKSSRVKTVPQPSIEPPPRPPADAGGEDQLRLGPALTLVAANGRARTRGKAAAKRAAELAAYVAEHPPRQPQGELAAAIAALARDGGARAAWLAPLHVHQATDAGHVLGAPPGAAEWIRERYAPALQRALDAPVRVLECDCIALDTLTA